ncbi:MAG: hypothetical protein N2507_05405 [Candidatus Bipolaricaulota bacterium]|nr:hypothetical protein [Candidatus Bipolaricaulota bacterium]
MEMRARTSYNLPIYEAVFRSPPLKEAEVSRVISTPMAHGLIHRRKVETFVAAVFL